MNFITNRWSSFTFIRVLCSLFRILLSVRISGPRRACCESTHCRIYASQLDISNRVSNYHLFLTSKTGILFKDLLFKERFVANLLNKY